VVGFVGGQSGRSAAFSRYGATGSSAITAITIDTYGYGLDTSRLGGMIDSSLKAGVEIILQNFSMASHGETAQSVAKFHNMFIIVTPDGTEAWIVKNPQTGRPPGPQA
jgi:hypothetical protein